jgi:acyl carrier protein
VFHTSLALHSLPNGSPGEEIRTKAAQSMAEEQELLVDPAFFRAVQAELPEITAIEVRPKRGVNRNELTQFRYDVVLRIGDGAETPTLPAWHPWHSLSQTAGEVSALMDAGLACVGYRQVPNARVADEALATAKLRGETAATEAAVSPDDVYALSEQIHCQVDVRWDHTDEEGRFDVVFHRDGVRYSLEPLPAISKPRSSLVSNPAQALFAKKIVPQLRSFLAGRLPEYMIPSAFLLLSEFPLTKNGKVDRAALPAPGQVRTLSETEYLAPRNELEEKLTVIWSEVLGVSQIGIHDNFFTQLGGHSLTATQLVSRVREQFDIELPIRTLFESPTIARLSEAMEAYLKSPTRSAARMPKIRRVDAIEETAVDVSQLSDDQVEAMLAQLLDEGAAE